MDKQSFMEHYRTLDRSLFVDEELRHIAKADHPLPIGHGQTISQPSLVAQMTIALNPEPDSRVLEIGTGSGYQTAMLAPFCKEVYSIERIPELLEAAKERLAKLDYRNIHFKLGNGYKGWAEEALLIASLWLRRLLKYRRHCSNNWHQMDGWSFRWAGHSCRTY